MKENHEQPQYLTFQVAGEEYTAGILQVREIIEYSVLIASAGRGTSATSLF